MVSMVLRTTRRVAAALCFAAFASAHAQSPDQSAFVQIGDGDSRTRSGALGYTRAFGTIDTGQGGRWDFHGEASLGRWFARGDDDAHRAFTQFGLTPVARYGFAPGRVDWFAEIGVGVKLIVPIFHSGDRHFSTAFNFGDHVAVGARFGALRVNEIALRVQHFSNGGVRQPNPGEDFVQLRYARHF